MASPSRRSATALRSTARILFGADWHSGLRAVLDISAETLDSWLEDRTPIPEAAWSALEGCMQTVDTMQQAQQKVRNALYKDR